MTTNTTLNLENSISLRVHFQLESAKTVDEILDAANSIQKNTKSQFSLKVLDQHLWFGIAKKHQKMYSPNLHLELEQNESGKTIINAKFGPDPALWTLFMFLHFGLALAIISLAVVAYANYALEKAVAFQLTLIGVIGVIWIGLYVFARINRNRGKGQAKDLLAEAQKIL